MRASKTIVQDEGALGLAGWSGPSRGMASAHRHLDLEINYVLTGTLTYLVGGRIISLPPQCLCLLWGGVAHQTIRSPRNAEAIWVTVPLTTVLRWGLPDLLIRPLLANGFVADVAPRPGDLDLLQQWLHDLPRRGRLAAPAGADVSAAIAQLEIEARLRRLALGLSHRSLSEVGAHRDPSIHSDHGLDAVEVMAQFIAKNFRTAIGVVEIAEEGHLHPNYAMTLFRRHTGMTLTQYLTLQRVAHAQRCLLVSGKEIQQIAFESGFGSVSRFYEAFRKQTGNSPRQFRLRIEACTDYDQTGNAGE